MSSFLACTFPVVPFPLPLIPSAHSVYYIFSFPFPVLSFFFISYALFPIFIFLCIYIYILCHLRIHSESNYEIFNCLFCSFLSLFHLFNFHYNDLHCSSFSCNSFSRSFLFYTTARNIFISSCSSLFSCHASPL